MGPVIYLCSTSRIKRLSLKGYDAKYSVLFDNHYSLILLFIPKFFSEQHHERLIAYVPSFKCASLYSNRLNCSGPLKVVVLCRIRKTDVASPGQALSNHCLMILK